MITSRSLDDLNKRVAQLAQQFVSACAHENIDIIITSTYRDKEAQDALFAKGRTKPGKIITNARGGESFHNHHVAFDFVPVRAGKACWDDVALFKHCGELAESVGLEWSGRWSGKFKELAHCQFTNGLTIDDFKKGKTL